MFQREEEYAVRIIEDDGSLMCERPGKAWSIMLFINRFGIDRVLLRPLYDWDGPFLPAREFGFKPSRIIKNRAIAEARLRNRQPRFCPKSEQ